MGAKFVECKQATGCQHDVCVVIFIPFPFHTTIGALPSQAIKALGDIYEQDMDTSEGATVRKPPWTYLVEWIENKVHHDSSNLPEGELDQVKDALRKSKQTEEELKHRIKQLELHSQTLIQRLHQSIAEHNDDRQVDDEKGNALLFEEITHIITETQNAINQRQPVAVDGVTEAALRQADEVSTLRQTVATLLEKVDGCKEAHELELKNHTIESQILRIQTLEQNTETLKTSLFRPLVCSAITKQERTASCRGRGLT